MRTRPQAERERGSYFTEYIDTVVAAVRLIKLSTVETPQKPTELFLSRTSLRSTRH